MASQITPSQALELLSELTTVPETEVPLVESENEAEAYTPPVLEREIDRPYQAPDVVAWFRQARSGFTSCLDVEASRRVFYVVLSASFET